MTKLKQEFYLQAEEFMYNLLQMQQTIDIVAYGVCNFVRSVF